LPGDGCAPSGVTLQHAPDAVHLPLLFSERLIKNAATRSMPMVLRWIDLLYFLVNDEQMRDFRKIFQSLYGLSRQPGVLK
jgi:hypothetical protein